MQDAIVLTTQSHDMMFRLMVISLCASFLIYHVYALIAHFLRRKKLKQAASMIADGHAKVTTGRKDIIVDGVLLDSDFILNKLEAGRTALKNKEAASIQGRKKAEAKKIRQDKQHKKEIEAANKRLEKQIKKESQPTTDDLLNSLYEAEDMMDMSLQSLEEEKRNQSTNGLNARPDQKEKKRQKEAADLKREKKIKEKNKEKAIKKRKKEKQTLDNISTYSDTSIF